VLRQEKVIHRGTVTYFERTGTGWLLYDSSSQRMANFVFMITLEFANSRTLAGNLQARALINLSIPSRTPAGLMQGSIETNHD
jgi:hypothetical protein